MRPPGWAPVTALCIAAAAAVAGLVLTRDRAPAPAPQATAHRGSLVDQLPLQTARGLIPLAMTPEEKAFVHHAERLANHELDLAFADALRNAAENPPAPTPETRERLAHKTLEEEAVKADELRIAQLTRQLAAAAGQEKDSLQTRLDVAKAQLELDQDELDQATEDLERVGGDPQARIRRLQAAHAAADAAPPGAAPAPGFFKEASLLGKFRAWSDSRAKVRRLAQAGQDARAKVQLLAQRREARARKVEQEREGREQTKQAAAGFAQTRGAAAREDAAGHLDLLKRYMLDQRMLSDLGRRMQDEQDLDEVYAGWGALALTQQRAALHVLVKWLSGVLLVLALAFLGDQLLEHLFRRRIQDNKRVGRLLKVVKYGSLAAGAVAILCIAFGLPSQMTTLFGLAGAGLTVALKDFIVAFFGWFVLVGRNGIHVGDWVEINGVGGEVVEIGLLRTMLLETGNWNDCGHPTGRIVSFVNSFAMEKHFFNFSSSGQWMWDELRLAVPPGQDPFPLIDAIRRRVEQETGANASLAEAEWRKATKPRRADDFSARPVINVEPAASGVEIRIRYITRAYERHDTRSVLNQALVQLLRGQAGTP